LPARSFSITLTAKGRGRAGGIESPTRTGIALIRMIQRRQDDLPIIQAAQQSIRSEIVKT